MKHLERTTRFLLFVTGVAVTSVSCRSNHPSLFTTPPYDPSPREYMCRSVSSDSVVVDGTLGDRGWQKADVMTAFVTAGKAPTTAVHQTECRLVWTESTLLAAFRCSSPTARAAGTTRDCTVWDGESAELLLCPRGADRPYFEIDVNSSNAVYDTYIRSWHWADLSTNWLRWAQGFNPSIQTAVHVEKSPDGKVIGWTAEMAIPFHELRGTRPPRPDETWRFNAARAAVKPDGGIEFSSWEPTYGDFHRPFSFPGLRFVK